MNYKLISSTPSNKSSLPNKLSESNLSFDGSKFTSLISLSSSKSLKLISLSRLSNLTSSSIYLI